MNKGPDQANIYFQLLQNRKENNIARDEISEYLQCRYISEQDALWRLLGYEVHHHTPAVERLPVHLPYANIVPFKNNSKLKKLIEEPDIKKTKLTEWFTTNQKNPKGLELTYCGFPSKFTWIQKHRTWEERKHGDKIGRLYYVNPSEGERFYLRQLLMIVKGAKSYDDIKTYKGTIYSTFKEACIARGLLANDNEWYDAFKEATTWASAFQLRNLFVTMLLHCQIQNEKLFFEANWKHMVDDYKLKLKRQYHPIDYNITDDELVDMLLDELQEIFLKNNVSQ